MKSTLKVLGAGLGLLVLGFAWRQFTMKLGPVDIKEVAKDANSWRNSNAV